MVKAAWLGADLTVAHDIRREVFINEQGVPEAEEMDGTDGGAFHLAAYVDDVPAATGRVLFENDVAVIGRVAVLKPFRKQGLGGLVMRMLIRRACETGYDTQVIHAQTRAVGFYAKLGFTQESGEFMEAGIPHVTMVHKGDVGGMCNG